MILLVVDTQKGCFDERLYAFETVRKNIKELITVARENGVEVAYVQHDDGPGTDLDKATENYEIYEEFAPRADERRFEKNVNSAFHPMTGLTEYLQSRGEKDVMAMTTVWMQRSKADSRKGFIYLFRHTPIQRTTTPTLTKRLPTGITMNSCGERATRRSLPLNRRFSSCRAMQSI